MIKIENTHVDGFEAAIRGMRNPLNSWDKSDSDIENDVLGEKDLALAKKLVKAGTDHSKFMRMINVTIDITAPMYWIAEHDTYKVGATRNSCSFMHKGLTKPFTINDFSISDENIPYLINDLEKQRYELIYPYNTEEYKIYKATNGRDYKVFRNGKIVACAFDRIDNYGKGRKRHFEERVCQPSENRCGYYELSIGGRAGEKWLVHRLVATVWLDNPQNFETVNHINGNKGDNSVENLEWASRSDNIKLGFEAGLYNKNILHFSYKTWKNSSTRFTPFERANIKQMYEGGLTPKEIASKMGCDTIYVNRVIWGKSCEYDELFQIAYLWETIIGTLNGLRELYLETKDDKIFFEIRQLLPSGYNQRYTWQANYQVLRNIYHARKNHKLDEWRDFCKWIETLPYAKELIVGEES